MNGQGAKLSKRSPWSWRYFIRLGNTASCFRKTGRVLNIINLFRKGRELLNVRIGFRRITVCVHGHLYSPLQLIYKLVQSDNAARGQDNDFATLQYYVQSRLRIVRVYFGRLGLPTFWPHSTYAHILSYRKVVSMSFSIEVSIYDHAH